MTASAHRFVVVGQIGRDLVLRIDGDLASDAGAQVVERREVWGGKGANQAVGLRELGGDVALVSVVGDDAVGRGLLESARADGIDVCGVAERGESALLVDVVDGAADRRLLEHVPASSLLTVADIADAGRHFRRAGTVCLQLQQPVDALLAAARAAADVGARIAADGGIDADDPRRDELLAFAEVLRADAAEAAQLVGFEISALDDAERAAGELLATGPRVVAIAVPDRGDLVAWPGGHRLYPFGDAPVVDRTGAGDAFFAGLVTGLARGWHPAEAGHLAADAGAATVSRLGGRPDLTGLASG